MDDFGNNNSPCEQLLDLWTSDPDETTLDDILRETTQLVPQLVFPGGSFCCKARLAMYGKGATCGEETDEYWSAGPVPAFTTTTDYSDGGKIARAFIPSPVIKRWGEDIGNESRLPALGKLELFYSLSDSACLADHPSPPREHLDRLQGLAKRLGRVITNRWKMTEYKEELSIANLKAKRLRESFQLTKLGMWELDLITNKLCWSDEIFELFQVDKRKFGASYEGMLVLCVCVCVCVSGVACCGSF